MGAFFLVHRGAADETDSIAAGLQAQFERQGFRQPRKIGTAHCDIFIYKKISEENKNVYLEDENNFCISVGTLLYKNNIQELSLQMFLDDFRNDSVAWDKLYGHFCLIVNAGGHLRLFTDRLGVYPVWYDTDKRVFSSSFLAVLSALRRPSIDLQCVYEYVFQGSTYGGKTLIREIALLDCTGVAELGAECRFLDRDTARQRRPTSGSFGEHLDKNLANLRRYYQSIAACFGDKVDTALSGGYDSRLTLALLLEQKVSPRVHVYGRDDDADVTIARAIADGEGIDLQQTDKSRTPKVDRDAFPELVGRNCFAFHGQPDNGLFENGMDLTTRMERCADGELMLNGGCGEVFRNFFYLPDRSYTVRQLIWTFYSQFDPNTCTDSFDERAYHTTLGSKIKQTLGRDDDVLDRTDIEFLYPAFRGRFWMGKNNSINNQLGWALTPFGDPNIMADAIAVPLKYKNFGRFEAEMIRSVNPALANYGSVYGHDFAHPPPWSRIFKDMSTLMRPTWLRRYAYRLKRRSGLDRPYFLQDSYLSTVIDVSFPYMGRFFHVNRILDQTQFNRLCTLEYLFERFQPDLPPSL